MMILDKLQLKHWKHLPSEHTVTFQTGLNVLQAPNFVGKTSILEALQYAVTGIYPQNKPDTKSFWIADDASVATLTLFFTHQEKSYKLIRSLARRKTKGMIENELYLVKADGILMKLAEGYKKVDGKIKEFFNWRDLTLNRFIFMDEFIVEKMNERTTHLDKLLKTILVPTKLKKYRKQLENQLEEYEKQATQLEQDWNKTQERLKESTKSKTELEQEKTTLVKKIEELRGDLDKKKQRQKTLKHKNDVKQKVIAAKKKQKAIWKLYDVEDHTEFLRQESLIEGNLENKQEEIQSLHKEIDLLEGMKQVIEKLQDNINQGKPVCPVCKSKIEDIDAISKHVADYVEQADQTIAKKQQKLPALETAYKELREKLKDYLQHKQQADAQRDIIEQLQPTVDLTKDYEKLLKTENKVILKLEREKNELQELLNGIKGNLKFLEQQQQTIVDMKGEAIQYWNDYHYTNLSLKALEDTEGDFLKALFHQIKQDISQYWKTFQEEDIEVILSSKREFKPAIKREQIMEIMELSGSEKMIFIILIALTLNREIFEYPFQCIDEPLERLDQENRQKFSQLLEQLVEPDKQLICTAVDNWHGDTGHIIDLQQVIQTQVTGGTSE